VHTSIFIRSGRQGMELAVHESVRKGEVLVHLPRRLQLTVDCDSPPPHLTGASFLLTRRKKRLDTEVQTWLQSYQIILLGASILLSLLVVFVSCD
jgi:hypothetical protein